MSDIFEEVEESLAKDKATELWGKYGLFVYLAAGLLVATVAFFEWRSYDQANKVEARMIRFEAAVKAQEDGDFDAAIEGFEALVAEDTPLSIVAGHQLAQARFFGQGDTENAATALEAVGAIDGGPLAQIALLKAAYLKADEMSLAELEVMLSDFVSTEGELANTAFGNLAQELLAAKAFEEGDLERARQEYLYLSTSFDATEGTKSRASFALRAIPETAAPAPLEPATEITGDQGGVEE